MNIKIDWRATSAAIAILTMLTLFPFVNPCETEDGTACTWDAQTTGNGAGSSFTDYYGVFLKWS